MAYMDEKNGGTAYASSPMTPNEPHSAVSRTSGYDSLAEFEKQDLMYKRRIRILRFVSRFLSLILAAFMIGAMSYALAKYYLTRNHIIAGGMHAWVTPARVWPTVMLLAIATVTFILDFFTLCTYCCGIGAANKASSVTNSLVYILMIVRVVVWGVTAGIFKMGSNGSSLWGYSCNPLTDQIHNQVISFVNFGRLCTVQQGSWYVSIIEAIAYLLTFFTTIFILKRASTKKKMAKARESTSMETGYNRQSEMGAEYQPGTGKRYMPVAVESPHV